MFKKLNCAVLATLACLGSTFTMANSEAIVMIQCGPDEGSGRLIVTAYSATIPEIKVKVGSDDCSSTLFNVLHNTASTYQPSISTTSTGSRVLYTVRLDPHPQSSEKEDN